jgi:hypothetical protein
MQRLESVRISVARFSTDYLLLVTSVVEPELRALEPKLNCHLERSRNYELRLRLLSIYHRLEEIL